MSKLRVPVGAEDHAQGNAKARCVLVEYGDYECPHCGRAHPIVKRLQRHFGEDLLFVFRNFPLTQAHPHAERAAETAEFAAPKGKFWQMHDLLFENQDRFGNPLFEELVKALDLSVSEFRGSVASEEYLPRIRADFTGGVRSGVNGTPTFFINSQRHNGPFDYEVLLDAIEAALRATHRLAAER